MTWTPWWTAALRLMRTHASQHQTPPVMVSGQMLHHGRLVRKNGVLVVVREGVGLVVKKEGEVVREGVGEGLREVMMVHVVLVVILCCTLSQGLSVET